MLGPLKKEAPCLLLDMIVDNEFLCVGVFVGVLLLWFLCFGNQKDFSSNQFPLGIPTRVRADFFKKNNGKKARN